MDLTNDRTYAKNVASAHSNWSPQQIREAKNARAHERNLARKAKRRDEAEARQLAFNALPLKERLLRWGFKISRGWVPPIS